jgi:4-amino-4-deoxy-L-arabinose transferase-like glycosyltransferase
VSKVKFILIAIALLYYSFFVNKGLVFFDEGYFIHNAERIYNGQIIYKDFAVQYGPTFFYLLATLYAFFTPSILIGRILTAALCLCSIVIVFIILNRFKAKSFTLFLSFLSLISFGYPLINIPNIIWLNVLLALLLVLVFLKWIDKPKSIHVLGLGALLALSISAKQNLGLAFVILFSFLMLFFDKGNWQKKIKNLLLLELTWALLTFSWIYFFFLKDNWSGLLDFVHFSKIFAQTIGFSYPPITLLFQPLGFFKLLPYYLPLLLFLITLHLSTKKRRDVKRLVFILTALVGFFVSIFPQSDLLHTYPFLGMILVSLLLLDLNGIRKIIVISLVCFGILTGFYLTFFTKSYRYERFYLKMNSSLNLPKAKGILVPKDDQKAITEVYDFINKHTKKNDYIFAYPNAPLVYFILDRKNPSKDSHYEIRPWHFFGDRVILSDIRNKKVKYIVANRGIDYDSDVSRFVQKQKLVLESQEFKIFEIK